LYLNPAASGKSCHSPSRGVMGSPQMEAIAFLAASPRYLTLSQKLGIF
jgi:hypothetical protein